MYLGYQIGQAQTLPFQGMLNGTLNEQFQETGISEYTTDLRPWINEETLQGIEIGYQYLVEDLYFDFSYSLFYRNEYERTKGPYAIPISNVGRSYMQGVIGKYYKHEQSIFFAGMHLGVSSTWLRIDPSYEIHITLNDEEEDMFIGHDTIRTGIRVGAQSGVTQGIRVLGEYGIDLLGNRDQKFFLGYFFTI